MAGYLNNRQETLKVIKKGKLYTGDLAFMNEGDLYILLVANLDLSNPWI